MFTQTQVFFWCKMMLLINLHPLKHLYVMCFVFLNQILPLFWNLQYFIILDTFTQKNHIYFQNSLLSQL